MAFTIQDVLKRAVELRSNFAFMIYQLHPVQMDGSKVITSDRFMRLYYDQELLDEWELDWCAARILVQIEHYYRHHSKRQLGREQVTWDVASEIVITDALANEGIKMHPNTLYSEHVGLPEGLSVEEAATRLFQVCSAKQEDFRKALEEMTGLDLPMTNSAASEEIQDWEIPEEEDLPTLDYMSALMYQRTLEQDSTPGTAPGNEVRTSSEVRLSEVEWEVEFMGVVGSTLSTRPGADDYSYALPGDETGYGGVIMPGMVSRNKSIAVVVDTSSSMGESRIAQSLAEIIRMLRYFQSRGGGSIFLYSCDVAAHSSGEIAYDTQIKLIGGGGTDIGVGIKAAALQNPRPDLIVCITDGDTPWPTHAPQGIPVLVVLVNQSNKKKPPKWVKRVIHVKM